MLAPAALFPNATTKVPSIPKLTVLSGPRTCKMPTVSEQEQMAPSASAVAVRLPFANPIICNPTELKKVMEAA